MMDEPYDIVNVDGDAIDLDQVKQSEREAQQLQDTNLQKLRLLMMRLASDNEGCHSDNLTVQVEHHDGDSSLHNSTSNHHHHLTSTSTTTTTTAPHNNHHLSTTSTQHTSSALSSSSPQTLSCAPCTVPELTKSPSFAETEYSHHQPQRMMTCLTNNTHGDLNTDRSVRSPSVPSANLDQTNPTPDTNILMNCASPVPVTAAPSQPLRHSLQPSRSPPAPSTPSRSRPVSAQLTSSLASFLPHISNPFARFSRRAAANMMAPEAPPDKLSVLVATWNVGGQMPVFSEFASWLPNSEADSPDIVSIGVQECSYTPTGSEKLFFDTKRRILRDNMLSVDSSLKMLRRPASATSGAPPPRKKRSIAIVRAVAKHRERTRLVSKDHFVMCVQTHFGPTYRLVSTIQLNEMRLVVLCKVSLKPYISDVAVSRKATGIGNVIGNKGGLMVQLKVHGLRLCFLSCHLAAHESEIKVAQRNHDVFEILKAISSSSPTKSSHHSSSSAVAGAVGAASAASSAVSSAGGGGGGGGGAAGPVDVSQLHDFMFVFGDLNYRLNMGNVDGRVREEEDVQHREVLGLVEDGDFGRLYEADQLRRELMLRNVLTGFKETPPNFEPTFKVARAPGLQYLDSRTPSYCDRILWTTLPNLDKFLTQRFFKSANEASTSDHKPVFSIFDVALVPRARLDGNLSHIGEPLLKGTLDHIKVKDLICADGSLIAPDLHVRGSIVSHETVSFHSKRVQCTEQFLKWRGSVQFSVLATKKEQLLHQHLVICVWDSNRSRRLVGQAVLSLDVWSASMDLRKFDVPLLAFGLPVGRIRGVLTFHHENSKSPHQG